MKNIMAPMTSGQTRMARRPNEAKPPAFAARLPDLENQTSSAEPTAAAATIHATRLDLDRFGSTRQWGHDACSCAWAGSVVGMEDATAEASL